MKSLLTVIMLLVSVITASASTVILQWDASTDASVTGQKVYYSNVNTPPFTGTGATQGNSGFLVTKGTGATVSGLDSAKPYYFAVTNYNGTTSQESVYSNVVSIPAFPIAPANVRSISIVVTP
jgi:hypothetical protein